MNSHRGLHVSGNSVYIAVSVEARPMERDIDIDKVIHADVKVCHHYLEEIAR